jgi:hypothetical protein
MTFMTGQKHILLPNGAIPILPQQALVLVAATPVSVATMKSTMASTHPPNV